MDYYSPLIVFLWVFLIITRNSWTLTITYATLVSYQSNIHYTDPNLFPYIKILCFNLVTAIKYISQIPLLWLLYSPRT